MKHIVIDLEMNRVAKQYKYERSICNMEIIEFGAVVLDEKYQEIGSFMTFVKPQFNEIVEPFYTKLTGITTEMVENAPCFEDALNMFISWCKSVKGDIQIYQWSENDLNQIRSEMLMKKINLPESDVYLFAQWEDFQKEFGETLGLEKTLSLQNAVMYAGIEFEGRQHDALFDARNTGTLLNIVRDPERRKDALEHVMDALRPKEISASLGEMFDFSKFVLAS